MNNNKWMYDEKDKFWKIPKYLYVMVIILFIMIVGGQIYYFKSWDTPLQTQQTITKTEWDNLKRNHAIQKNTFYHIIPKDINQLILINAKLDTLITLIREKP
jgi:hypothetical protein